MARLLGGRSGVERHWSTIRLQPISFTHRERSPVLVLFLRFPDRLRVLLLNRLGR